jgi:hypothetical protein
MRALAKTTRRLRFATVPRNYGHAGGGNNKGSCSGPFAVPSFPGDLLTVPFVLADQGASSEERSGPQSDLTS